MIEQVEKNVQVIQLKEISLDFLCKFYEKVINRKKIILIYNGDNYYTNIAYEEVVSFVDECEFVYFLRYNCKRKSVDEGVDALNNAETIFKNNCCVRYVLINNNKQTGEGKRMFFSDTITCEMLYKKHLMEIKVQLLNEGVNVFIVKIPRIYEVKKEKQHPEWKFGSLNLGLNWGKTREAEIKKYLSKISELDYREYKKRVLSKKSSHHNTDTMEMGKRIFLVGRCTVGGWENIPEDSLTLILKQKLDIINLDYSVISVVLLAHADQNWGTILEYDIHQNDIVIFIDEIFDKKEADLDLSYLYNQCTEDRWLYTNLPVHTTRKGNELIADELIKYFIEPVTKRSDGKLDLNILHKEEEQLTYEEICILDKYLSSVNESIEYYLNGIIGACVMTCNPFTKGHYHLIEYASKKVDYLYVFVVEEDAFLIPFSDRIEMVRRGVNKLENVIVIPSGKLIISNITFKNYFEKEIHPDDNIKASKDTMIFKKYIVPALGISKRFVGEEKEDNITNQYNQLLKADLSESLEVVEIPRKKVEGITISASRVREYMKAYNWNEIKKMVPETTFEYLKSKIDFFKVKNIGQCDEIAKFIRDHDKIVICGLGADANVLMKELEYILDASDIGKLVFYDKKADRQKIYYRGKEVIDYKVLISKYSQYFMLITTSLYKKELFFSLYKSGINPDKIMIASEMI